MGAGTDAFNASQVKVLERVATGAPLPEVLDAVVRLVEERAEGMLCSILLFDEARQSLGHGAAPSLPAAYTRLLDGSQIGPEAGSCGAAASLRERVVVEDIATHPYWAKYRDLALPHQLRTCWSTPIFSPERELRGTFAMYYGTKRSPTEEGSRGWMPPPISRRWPSCVSARSGHCAAAKRALASSPACTRSRAASARPWCALATRCSSTSSPVEWRSRRSSRCSRGSASTTSTRISSFRSRASATTTAS